MPPSDEDFDVEQPEIKPTPSKRARPSVEVRDVFASLPQSDISQLSPDKLRVVRAVLNCRTAALGSHTRSCTLCSHQEISYNSCRNRHCPKCQGAVAARWVEARAAELLPTGYAHTVFTLPAELRSLAYQNKHVVYELLFSAVADTLKAVAANPKFLGTEITFFSLLHTWNQKLEYHPHLHIVSPRGGISLADGTWVDAPKNFFLPVRALSKVFRGKMIEALRLAHRKGKLKFYGPLKQLESPMEFEKLLGQTRKSDWVVYSKKPFGGPTQVLKYLSAYIHRVAISNHRLRNLDSNSVSFVYRDSKSKSKNKRRLLTLSNSTFTKRFLLHILPRGFTRIRHYGLLSTATKRKYLPILKQLLQHRGSVVSGKNNQPEQFSMLCPNCNTGQLRAISVQMIRHSAAFKPIQKPKFPLSPQAPPLMIRAEPVFGA